MSHALTRLVNVALLLTYLLIVIGAATRVTDSGMSCPDWPMCYGKWFPFPLPEGAGYATYQVLLEWGHRFLAMVIGFLMLAIGVLAFQARRVRPAIWYWTLAAFVILFIQVKIGGITVWFSNIHWSVALHLGVAMLFFATLITLRRLCGQGAEKGARLPVGPATRSLTWVVALVVWVTMLTGAMVSSAHAGGSCGGLLSCFGAWMPHDDFQQLLHMKHRFLALLSFVLIITYYFVVRRTHPEMRKSAIGLKILLLGQVALGVLTLYSFSYFAWGYMFLSVLHLAWGTLLFMACVGTLGKIYFGTAGSFHART